MRTILTGSFRKKIKLEFLLLAYLFIDAIVGSKRCNCPKKENWPVPYNYQMFCGKELMKLSTASDCESERKYHCKRNQVEAIGNFSCQNARYKYCSPKLERHCTAEENPDGFESCMTERACVIQKWADANMKATYENKSKS
jgi:hypothetical protein